ncbi:MAG: DNA-3-methyladenine glycosylase [Spirochaetia bacterium]|nr:DNA-3-methyladenine glycosylase [Spirochaetia bacterium]
MKFKNKIYSFLSRPAIEVAPDLIGCRLIRNFPNSKSIEALIVETEGYTEGDPACHAYRRKTKRNSIMFGMAGYTYIYKIYGIHHCLNIVTDLEDIPSGVLIRAVEFKKKDFSDLQNIHRLGAGPGKLCNILNIDTKLNGKKLGIRSEINLNLRDKLFQKKIDTKKFNIIQTTRIGITQGMDLPWRWYLDESKSISQR